MSARGTKVLVTGGAGFIGSHLCEALVADGRDVTVVDNLSTGRDSNLGGISREIQFHQADVRTPAFLDLVVEGRFQTIFHLAANAYVPPSVEDPSFDFENNCLATFRLLECIRSHRLDLSLLVMSSAAVYGNPASMPVTEQDPTFPLSPYGAGKLAMERYASVYSRVYGLRVAALRLFSVYGPRQRKQIVFDFMTKLSRDPTRLEILGDGTQVRDLVYVGDVVEAALLVAGTSPLRGEVYNVGLGQGITTADLASAMARIMDLAPRFEYTGSIRRGDSEKWIASTARLAGLGFAPQVTLDTGLKRTIEWFRLECLARPDFNAPQEPHNGCAGPGPNQDGSRSNVIQAGR